MPRGNTARCDHQPGEDAVVTMPERQHTPSGAGLPQEAVWIAQHVGGGTSSPLSRSDISALAASLGTRRLRRGETAFESHGPSTGAWIVRSGRLEPETGSNGSRQGVLRVLRPGDVDGDIQSLLRTPMPCTARAVEESVCLCVAPDHFARLLRRHPALARRWMAGIAVRLERSQGRFNRSLQHRAVGASVAARRGHRRCPRHPAGLPRGHAGGSPPLPEQGPPGVRAPGLIHVRYGAIEILDPEGLAKNSG